MTEDRELFKCSQCGHEYEHEAGDSVQCPACGYESSVFPMSMLNSDGPKPKKRKRIGRLPIAQTTLLWVGIPVISVLVLMSQIEQCNQAEGPSQKNEGSAGQMPQGMVDPSVQQLANDLAPDGSLATLHQEFFSLLDGGNLTKGSAMDSPLDPVPPHRLALTVTDKKKAAVRPFEWGLLFGDLARTQGHSISYAVAKDVMHAKTDINRRQVILVADDGTYYNPWTGATGNESVHASLSILQVAALGDAIASLEHLENAEIEKAQKRIQSARKQLPDDPGIPLIEGQIALAEGKTEEGLALLAEAVQTGKDAHSHFVLGTAYLIENSLFKAFKEFEAASRIEPRFGEAWLALGGVELRRMEMIPKEQHDDLLKRVDGFLDKAMGAEPDLEGLQTAKAQVALLRGEENSAVSILDAAMEKYPTRAEPAVLRGQIAFQNQNMKVALDAFAQAALAEPDRNDIRELMGMACMTLESWQPCITALESSLKDNGKDPIVRIQLASALRENGQNAAAKGHLKTHSTLFPEDATGPLLLAQLLLDEGTPGLALPLIEKGLLLSPVTEAYVLEFIALRMLGKKDEAMAVVSRLGVKDPQAHTLMTQALLEQGKMEDAEAVLHSWRKHKPNDTEAPVLLAMVYEATGKTEKADQLQAEVLAKTPAEEQEELKMRFRSQREYVLEMMGASPEAVAN